jgi:alkaline phosphatase D
MLSGVASAWAQHDLHRNATQAIAVDDTAFAAKILQGAAADDPETSYVRVMLELQRQDVPAAERAARIALEQGLPFARLVAGPRYQLQPLYETAWYKQQVAQHSAVSLLHGPMVGRVTDHSAAIWVRTAAAAEVQVNVAGRPSSVAASSAASDFTAVVTVDSLAPATRYDYEVLVDGKKVDAEQTTFETFPAQGQPARFRVAFGGGAGYLPDQEYMWDTIRAHQPLAMLMLGDNVYIDQPEHTLCQHYCYYRRQTRPEWRRLVASTAIFSIYDDHDFGTDDCVAGPAIDTPPWKRSVWNLFRQNWVNPGYGGGEANPGCWYDFHVGDVHFIMLDGRYYRDEQGRSMLGDVQKKWLLDTLEKSRGTFKVLASPVPWTAGIKPGSRDAWDGFAREREEIFSFIESHRIAGVFLIAADRHRTDLRRTVRDHGYDLWELESSRLTNRHLHEVVKTPGLIWGYNDTCSFALMSFDTTAADPMVKFACVSIDGDTIHEYELPVSALRY